MRRDAEDFLIAQQDNGGFQIEEPTGGEVYPRRGRFEVSDALISEAGQEITLSGTFPPLPWCKESDLRFSVRFTLLKGESALGISIRLHWQGEGTRVRMKLPNLVNSARGMYEIPFGTVERGAYDGRRTARGEWPAQRFVAVEDGRIGLALINRGMAGVQTVGSTLVTTLLRAYKPGPMSWVSPTPLTSCHGESTFAFLAAPYHGEIESSDVYRLAQRFNNPSRIVGTAEAGAGEASFLSLEPRNLVLSAVKTADDDSGDLIVRNYETAGRKTQANLWVRGAHSAMLSDLAEARGDALPCTRGRMAPFCAPYEIQTLRVKRVLP